MRTFAAAKVIGSKGSEFVMVDLNEIRCAREFQFYETHGHR